MRTVPSAAPALPSAEQRHSRADEQALAAGGSWGRLPEEVEGGVEWGVGQQIEVL